MWTSWALVSLHCMGFLWWCYGLKKKVEGLCVGFIWHCKIATERKVSRNFIMASSLGSQSIIFIIMKHRNNDGWRQVCNSESMSSETMAKKGNECFCNSLDMFFSSNQLIYHSLYFQEREDTCVFPPQINSKQLAHTFS